MAKCYSYWKARREFSTYYAFVTLKLMYLFTKKKEKKRYSVYYHHKNLWNDGSTSSDRYGSGRASSDW
ncbi:MAG: hypothetical protein ACLTXM_07260 [Enterococcus sp.]